MSSLLALAWLAWGRDGAASGGLDFAVSDRVHDAVRPHLQKADLAGFVAAHARHDPVGALRREEKSRGGTRRHGAGFGSGSATTSPFPKAWGEDVVSTDADPRPAEVLAPANPEPPSPPPTPMSAHMNAAPGRSRFWRPPLPKGADAETKYP